MKKIFYSGLVAFTAAAAALTGCSQADGTASEIIEKDLCLSDTIASMIKVDTAQLQPVVSLLKLSGKVAFDDQKVFKIYPLVGGYVQEVKVELGDYVQKGQTLAILKSGEVAEFEQQLSAAQSQFRLAQKNLDVTEDMFKAGLVSEKDFVAAQQEKKNAEASLKRIKEIFSIYSIGNGSTYVVKAPSSGFILEKTINAGMQIRPDNDENIFTISSMNEIWVMANVFESDIAKIKVGYEAEVTTLSYPDKVFKGKIDKIYNVLDPETRTMKVRVRLENPDYQLKPEMFANIRILYRENVNLVAIPASAVVFDRNKNFVMVYRKRCDVVKREVQLYQTAGNTVYVSSGLSEGENVISSYPLLVYNATLTN